MIYYFCALQDEIAYPKNVFIYFLNYVVWINVYYVWQLELIEIKTLRN